MKSHRNGLSLLEILIALLVFSCLLIPLSQLLFSSQRYGGASAYEIMAVHYASEIVEQVRKLAPHLKSVWLATAKSLQNLLEDPSVVAALKEKSTDLELQAVVLPQTGFALLLSPLDPHFVGRTVIARRLDSSGASLLNQGTVWKVSVTLDWKLQDSEMATHSAVFSALVREE